MSSLNSKSLFFVSIIVYRLSIVWSYNFLSHRKKENADKELDKLFKLFASRETDSIRPKIMTIKGAQRLICKNMR